MYFLRIFIHVVYQDEGGTPKKTLNSARTHQRLGGLLKHSPELVLTHVYRLLPLYYHILEKCNISNTCIT